MNPDSDTLVTALYVRIDGLLVEHPEWAPQRPAVGIAPRLSDAELVTRPCCSRHQNRTTAASIGGCDKSAMMVGDQSATGPMELAHPDPGDSSSNRCARSSNRSTGPSNPNSASNATAAAPAPVSPHASCNDYSLSPQPSGTTKPPNNPAPPDPSPPTTTNNTPWN